MRIKLYHLMAPALALTASAVTACPPPPPPPQPPNVQRLEGETPETHRARIQPLMDAYIAAIAAEKAKEEQYRLEWLNTRIAAQKQAWDSATQVVLASIVKRQPRSDGHGLITYRVSRYLKGKRKVGKLQRDLFMGMQTSCGGYDPGIDGGTDGRFLIFLTNPNPKRLDWKEIIPAQHIVEPSLKAIIEEAPKTPS